MSRSESLLPREHGTYAELGFPLTTGLLLGEPRLAAISFAVAALAWFLLYEPVAVLTGRRGSRIARTLGDHAWRRALWLTGLGAVTGGLALAASTAPARLAALVPIGLALGLVPVVAAGRQKAVWAEVLVVAALTTMVLPVAIAGGVDWMFAWAASGVWFSSFVLGTVAVHGLKADHKRSSRVARSLVAAPVLGVAVMVGSFVAVWKGWVPPVVAMALLPSVIVTLVVCAARVHPRKLRAVGWSIVGANLVTLTVLVVGR